MKYWIVQRKTEWNDSRVTWDLVQNKSYYGSSDDEETERANGYATLGYARAAVKGMMKNYPYNSYRIIERDIEEEIVEEVQGKQLTFFPIPKNKFNPRYTRDGFGKRKRTYYNVSGLGNYCSTIKEARKMAKRLHPYQDEDIAIVKITEEPVEHYRVEYK